MLTWDASAGRVFLASIKFRLIHILKLKTPLPALQATDTMFREGGTHPQEHRREDAIGHGRRERRRVGRDARKISPL